MINGMETQRFERTELDLTLKERMREAGSSLPSSPEIKRMSVRFDEIDKRILYHLARDARGISAPDIADEVNVSAGSIRNRINRLEEEGVLEGYHARIDYERAERRHTGRLSVTRIALQKSAC